MVQEDDWASFILKFFTIKFIAVIAGSVTLLDYLLLRQFLLHVLIGNICVQLTFNSSWQ